jgi:hypothetical protein
MPVFLALLVLLGPFGHVIPSTDSGEGEGQSKGLGEPFDDLTTVQQQVLATQTVLPHVSGRTAGVAEDVDLWEWVTRAGVSDEDAFGGGVAVDSSGNAYVTGKFKGSADFGFTTLSSSGDTDVFVAKLDPNGIWLWAVRAGGSHRDSGSGIAVDSSGNAYVSGSIECSGESFDFGSTMFSCDRGEYRYDVFVAKLDSSGSWLWAKRAGD